MSPDVARHLASVYAAMGDSVTPMLGTAQTTANPAATAIFRAHARGDETAVDARIRDLVTFMESLQEK